MTPRAFAAARKRLGLTQKELGQRLEISTQAVADKERGRSPVTRRDELAIGTLRAKPGT